LRGFVEMTPELLGIFEKLSPKRSSRFGL